MDKENPSGLPRINPSFGRTGRDSQEVCTLQTSPLLFRAKAKVERDPSVEGLGAVLLAAPNLPRVTGGVLIVAGDGLDLSTKKGEIEGEVASPQPDPFYFAMRKSWFTDAARSGYSVMQDDDGNPLAARTRQWHRTLLLTILDAGSAAHHVVAVGRAHV